MAKWIEEWTSRIHEMSNNILYWGNTVNDDKPNSTWFQRNKTRIYTLGLFVALTFIFALLKWDLLVKVCLLMVAIQIVGNVWSTIKSGWKKYGSR